MWGSTRRPRWWKNGCSRELFPGGPNPRNWASFWDMKSSAIRLFAVDVDGTLLDSTHRLRTDVKDSVCRLAASGLEIALATARGPAAVREIVRQLDFSPWLICFSGGWIGELDLVSLQPKDIRLDHRISCAAAHSILGAAFSHNVEPNVFTPELAG